MRLWGFDISWAGNGQPAAPEDPLDLKQQTLTLEQLMQRLELAFQTLSGIAVTPETAMQSPTVQAIVRAISPRISTLPVHVFQKTTSRGRDKKEPLPNHPVSRLLSAPNDFQDRVAFWLDATSWLVRYGNFYAFKARGQTGPIRRLEPLHPGGVTVKQEDDLSVTYGVTLSRAEQRIYSSREIMHARGPSRDGVCGASPIVDARDSIALEIAAERFGGSFFGNGAMPLIMFTYMQGVGGFKTDEQRDRFVNEFQAAYTGKGRFRALLLPKGIEAKDPVTVDNDKGQFFQTRQFQRTVISGAFGVPPHLVGDLTKGTYNNVEQQSLDFVLNVVMPYVRIFEASMERSLLTDDDRSGGVIIRFNLDAALRADFQTRQAGLKIQRDSGVINPNEWREHEGMNPIKPEDGGDDYWRQGPSGQQAGGAKPEADDEAVLPGRNGNGNGR